MLPIHHRTHVTHARPAFPSGVDDSSVCRNINPLRRHTPICKNVAGLHDLMFA